MFFSGDIWRTVTPGGGTNPVAPPWLRDGELHPELHVLGSNAKLMLHHAARPQRGGLLIFRHADTLALEVGGGIDVRTAANERGGVEEQPRRKHRDADEPLVALGFRHHQR